VSVMLAESGEGPWRAIGLEPMSYYAGGRNENVPVGRLSHKAEANSLFLSSHGEPGRGATLLTWLSIVVLGLAIGLAAATEPSVGLLLVAGLLTIPWAVRNIHIVVLLLAVYTPFEESILRWMPGSLGAALRFAPEALILLLLAAIVLRNIGHGTWWKKTPIDLPAALFLGFSALSALANDVPPIVGIFGIREYSRYILLYYLVVNAGLTLKTMKVMIQALLAAAALEAGIGLMQVILGNRFSLLLIPEDVVVAGVMVRPGFTQILSGGTRIFGTLGRYNTFGFFLAIFCLLGLGLYLKLRPTLSTWHGRGLATLVCLSGPAMLLSFSRTSWFAFYAGGLVVLLVAKWKKTLLLAAIIPLLATVLLLSWVTLEDWRVQEAEEASLVDRYMATFTPGYVDVLLRHGRLFSLFRVSPMVLRDYTWLGLGPGTIGSIATGGGTMSPGFFPEYSHEDWLDVSDVGSQASLGYLHDVGWVSILAQVGVLGTVAYAWIIIEVLRVSLYCYRNSTEPFARGLALGYVGLLLATVLANFAIFYLSLRAVSMYFWLLAGLITTVYLRLRTETAPGMATIEEAQP
jgi:hypothetical protein